MSLVGRLFRGSSKAPPVRRSGYDAAKTTNENRKHWAEADALAPVSQLTPAVRRTLRNRSRYEVQNNGYAAGLIRTLVVDTVGTGPRLQMLTDDTALNEGVEDLWRLWSCATNFPLTTRILCGVKYVAGECFAVFRDSKRLEKLGYPVTLDLRLVEPDQVTDGFGGQLFQTTGDDGVEVDDDGDVTAYKVLRHHPGDNRAYMGAVSFTPDRIPVENVLHWFQPERPGQLRGVTPLAPSLDIFAQLRRFTKATLTAAEVASMLAGVMMTDAPVDGDAAAEVATFDTIELVRGMLVTLPGGRSVQQFKPEQPTTNYKMFVEMKLRECGRPLNVPFGKMAGDHSSYNYSSGRMDDAPYWHDRDVERQEIEAKYLDPVFWRFCDFARFVLPSLAAYSGKFWSLAHVWHYDAKPTSDPVKDATGDELNLTNGADTLSGIAARDGTTARALLQQRKRDLELYDEFDLPLPPWAAGTPAPMRQPAEGQPTSGPGSNPQQEGAARAA
jgi:lambda family phage portal protein